MFEMLAFRLVVLFNHWTVAWALTPKQTMCSNEDSVCAFLSWKILALLLHCKGTSVFTLENCSAAIKYKLPDPSTLFSFLSWNAGWNVLHTHIYSAVMYGLLSRMVATFGIPRKPQTSHIRQMAVVHAQINLHVCSSADNTHHVHTKTLWARWKQLEQQLCLVKIGVTDWLFFLELVKNFGRYQRFLLETFQLAQCFHCQACGCDSFKWALKFHHLLSILRWFLRILAEVSPCSAGPAEVTASELSSPEGKSEMCPGFPSYSRRVLWPFMWAGSDLVYISVYTVHTNNVRGVGSVLTPQEYL